MSTVITNRLLCRDLRYKISANIEGSITKSGTPNPDAPVKLVPLQTDSTSGIDVSSLNLCAVGTYKDIYNYSTKKITRYITKCIITGTENITLGITGTNYVSYLIGGFSNGAQNVAVESSHFIGATYAGIYSDPDGNPNKMIIQGNYSRAIISSPKTNGETADELKAWLAAQYAAGTPVIVYYPLATAVEDSTPLLENALLKAKYPGVYHKITHSGKNLFNPSEDSQTISGVTFTKHDDGSFDIVGTATAQINAVIGYISLKAGDYTAMPQSPSGVRWRYREVAGSWTSSHECTAINNFTLSEDRLNGDIIITVSSGSTVNYINQTFMMLSGTYTTQQEYEQFYEVEKDIDSTFYSTINTKKEVTD